MNNIVANFPQILQFAQQLQLPVQKKRGIIREFLQTKFIHDLYSLPKLAKLNFVGGTSLRLLYGLPRFSEDLDFDNLGLEIEKVEAYFQSVLAMWKRENIRIEWIVNKTASGTYFEVRLPKLLYNLKITTNPKEKLRIKFDQTTQWQKQDTQVMLLNRFGFIEYIATNTLDQLLVQKLTAYVYRSETQARDIFDVVWLFAQGARLDKKFMLANNLGSLLGDAKEKYKCEGVPNLFVRRLQPFLFTQTAIRKLTLFASVLEKL